VALLFAALTLLGTALPASGAAPLSGQTICLDPGHGGIDSGAVNLAYDLYESDINLDEAYALAALLEGAGAKIVMTRTGNEGMTEAGRAAFCNQAGATLLVSMHTNSFVDAEPDGSLLFYGKRSAPKDVRLAQAIYDSLYPALLQDAPVPASFIEYGVRRFGAGVLRRSTMPAALVEPVFLSNPAEAALLATPIYTAPGSGVINPACHALRCRRGQIAQAVYEGVVDYFTMSAATEG
jgi:N-acetylmuramoyl-L-alanine amidase